MKTKIENKHKGSKTSTQNPIIKTTLQPNTLWTQLAYDFLTQKNITMKTRTMLGFLLAIFFTLSFNHLEAQNPTYQSPYFNFPEEDFDIEAMVTTPDGGTIFTGTRIQRDYYNREIIKWSGIYVIRTDANGKAKWLKYYTLMYNEVCSFQPTTIVNGVDGGFMVGGIFTGCLDVNDGMFLMSINDDGYVNNVKYHKKWDNYSSVLLKELKRDGNDGYVGIATVISGDYEKPIGTMVFKADVGGVLHARNLFSFPESDLEAKAIEIDPEEGYVILAENQHDYEGTYSTNPVVIKLDNQLNEVWNRYINSGLEMISAVDIAIGQSNNILVTGNINPFEDDKNLIYLISLDQGGDTDWENAFHWRECDVLMDGANEVRGLTVDEGGNIYIGGNAWPFLFDQGDGTFTSSIDPFVIRVNPGGLGKWLHFYGKDDDEIMNAMTDVDGGFSFGGHIFNTPSSHSNNHSAWVTKGNFYGDAGCDYREHPLQSRNHKFWPNVVAIDKSQEDLETLEVYASEGVQTIIAYICYVFNVTTASSMPMVANPNSDTDWGQQVLTPQSSSAIFPNPSDGKFNVRLDNYFENENPTNITILDPTGKVILTQSIEAIDTEFEMTHLAKGTYFVKIQSGEKLEQHKLIIQ